MDINDPEATMNSLPPLLCSQCKEGDKGSKAVLRVTGFSSSDRMAPLPETGAGVATRGQTPSVGYKHTSSPLRSWLLKKAKKQCIGIQLVPNKSNAWLWLTPSAIELWLKAKVTPGCRFTIKTGKGGG